MTQAKTKLRTRSPLTPIRELPATVLKTVKGGPEAWYSSHIQETPQLAGIPATSVLVTKEFPCETEDGKRKSLDLLFYDQPSNALFSVEVQVGEVDSDHIIRAYGYAVSLEGRREELANTYNNIIPKTPDDVFPVLVAEKIGGYNKLAVGTLKIQTVLNQFACYEDGMVEYKQNILGGERIKIAASPQNRRKIITKILDWMEPLVTDFQHDAGGNSTFEPRMTRTQNDIALNLKVGKKQTKRLSFWAAGQYQMDANILQLSNIPSEILNEWDRQGISYQTGAEGVYRFRSGQSPTLYLQLDENGRSVWAGHLAKAAKALRDNVKSTTSG